MFAELELVIATRAELMACGATPPVLTSAVRGGYLLRVRRDHYALPGTDLHVLRAVRIGGRVGCATALRSYGVFGFEHRTTHVHCAHQMSRMRSPDSRRRPWSRDQQGAILHWDALIDSTAGDRHRVGLVDALRQVLRCNHRYHALASLENAIFVGLVTEADLAEVFAGLPAATQILRARVNGRSEAGQETVLRSALEDAGIPSEIQVWIPGLGRVDGIVGGRLIWEADSRLAHDGWELHVRDRDRDIDAARLGYVTLRPAYKRTMFATAEVVEAVQRLLEATDRPTRFLH